MTQRIQYLWQSKWRYLLISLLTTLLLYLPFSVLTIPFSFKDFSIFFFPPVVFLTLLQYLLGPNLWNKAFLAPGIVSLFWSYSYLACTVLSQHAKMLFFSYHRNYIFGLVLFLTLISLQYLITYWVKKPRVVAIVFSLLEIILLIPTLTIWGYFLKFGECIDTPTIRAIYFTTAREAQEYILSFFSPFHIVSAILIILCFFSLFYYWNQKLFPCINAYPKRKHFQSLLALSLLPLLYYGIFQLSPNVATLQQLIGVHHYAQSLQSYATTNKEVYKTIQLSNTPLSQKLPGTVILVIGESANRSYMQAFTPSYPYNTTPWENQMRAHNKNFLFFDKGYSSYVQTTVSLERALTAANQYNQLDPSKVPSILNLAKKAGYHTYWFSSQDFVGKFNEPVGVIAAQSEEVTYTDNASRFNKIYDKDLLPLLQQINPNENNFIVLHLMGSHSRYHDRYPKEFTLFSEDSTLTDMELQEYLTSLRYTDSFLEETFEYAQKHLHLQAMVYFSDHGEDIAIGHMPEKFTYDMSRIPMWIYLSPQYIQAYPQIYHTLQAHEQTYFTNDMLYDMLSGLMHMESNYYNAQYDLTSPSYNMKPDQLTTMLGKIKITEDPLF